MNDAALKAATLAAAKELYKEQCKEVGVTPTAWSKLDKKIQERMIARAAEMFAAPTPGPMVGPTPATPEGAQHPGPPRDHPEGPLYAPNPVVAGGPTARVEARAMEAEDYNPSSDTVLLLARRGSIEHGLAIPSDSLSPDVASVMPYVLRNLIENLLIRQQGEAQTAPLNVNGVYALRRPTDGKMWNGDTRLDYADFTEELPFEGTKVPGLIVDVVDTQGQARTQATAARQAVPLGNPIVIGTEGQRGMVLGVPVGSGGGATPQAPAIPQALPAQPGAMLPPVPSGQVQPEQPGVGSAHPHRRRVPDQGQARLA
jgi:hypothetical protein